MARNPLTPHETANLLSEAEYYINRATSARGVARRVDVVRARECLRIARSYQGVGDPLMDPVARHLAAALTEKLVRLEGGGRAVPNPGPAAPMIVLVGNGPNNPENRVFKMGRSWWVRQFGSRDSFPTPFATKRDALATAARNEQMVKERGVTDADELAVLKSLAPPQAPTVKLSAAIRRASTGAPPGGWGPSDRVNPPSPYFDPWSKGVTRRPVEEGVLIEYATIPVDDRGSGWLPLIAVNGEAHWNWQPKGYDRDEALARAKQEAETQAARYAGYADSVAVRRGKDVTKPWKQGQGYQNPPTGDEEIRRLERAAATGDSMATQRLAALRQRQGMPQQMPYGSVTLYQAMKPGKKGQPTVRPEGFRVVDVLTGRWGVVQSCFMPETGPRFLSVRVHYDDGSTEEKGLPAYVVPPLQQNPLTPAEAARVASQGRQALGRAEQAPPDSFPRGVQVGEALAYGQVLEETSPKLADIYTADAIKQGALVMARLRPAPPPSLAVTRESVPLRGLRNPDAEDRRLARQGGLEAQARAIELSLGGLREYYSIDFVGYGVLQGKMRALALGRAFPGKGLGNGWLEFEPFAHGARGWLWTGNQYSTLEAGKQAVRRYFGSSLYMSNPPQPCANHNHPTQSPPVSEASFKAEVAHAWRMAGFPGKPQVVFTSELTALHEREPRRYAQVWCERGRFEFARQVLALPGAHRRGLIAHEVGHCLAPGGTERAADVAASGAGLARVGYDRRWPGKGLQVAANNPGDEPYLVYPDTRKYAPSSNAQRWWDRWMTDLGAPKGSDGLVIQASSPEDAIAKAVTGKRLNAFYLKAVKGTRRRDNPTKGARGWLSTRNRYETLEEGKRAIRRYFGSDLYMSNPTNPLGPAFLDGLAIGAGVGVVKEVSRRVLGPRPHANPDDSLFHTSKGVRPGYGTTRVACGVCQKLYSLKSGQLDWVPSLGVHACLRCRERMTKPNPRAASPLKLPPSRVKGTITIEEARRRRVPGIEEAIKRFKLFHGCEPSGTVTIYDDGRKDDVAGFIIGRTPELTYDDVNPNSNKAGNPWVHKTSKKQPTYLAHLPLMEQTVLVGHTRVREWLLEPGE